MLFILLLICLLVYMIMVIVEQSTRLYIVYLERKKSKLEEKWSKTTWTDLGQIKEGESILVPRKAMCKGDSIQMKCPRCNEKIGFRGKVKDEWK